MKSVLKRTYIVISKIFMRLFFDKKYLRGRWFDDNTIGWIWCWRCLWDQKVKGYNKHMKFPVNPSTVVGHLSHIHFDVDNIDNFWKSGCYFQCWTGNIFIGKGTYIAQNVGVITENHDPENLDNHLKSKDVVIGKNCWIGMNSVILPGVQLGDGTIVGAGAVVTSSFKEGNCVIGGTPAKLIKKI